MQTMIEQFQRAITDAGLPSPQTIIPDGKMHRFSTNCKPTDDAGWYVLHPDDNPAGAFGDWRTGVSESWSAKSDERLSAEERRKYRLRLAEISAQREAERILRQGEAREKAKEIWQQGEEATSDHPYLVRKGISSHGVRAIDGKLIIPMSDATGLQNLQFIMPDGSKRYLTGGKVKGCYFSIGLITGSILIAEGFATAASLHEVIGRMVVVAFSADNLLPVSKAICEQYSAAEIIICADDDFTLGRNSGLTKAREAACAIGARMAIPVFSSARNSADTDFNDLRRLQGDQPVLNAVLSAELPIPDTHDEPAKEPQQFSGSLLPVPSFDAELLLPQPLRAFVIDTAERMSCPPEFIAVSLIVALGSVIGARCAVRPKRNDDWLVVPNLWGLAVGEPSTRKSPAIGAALKPLDELVARAYQKYAREKQNYDKVMEALGREEKLHNRKPRGSAERPHRPERQQEQSMAPDHPERTLPEPKMRRYKTNDATVEKLIEILRDNPSGILNFRDELSGLFDTFERAGREGDRSFFLESWSGDRDYSSDRILRGSVYAPNICLSVLGGIQPQKLSTSLRQSRKSLASDGLLQRFQLLVYPDPVKWAYVDREPNRVAQDEVRRLFVQLADLDPVQSGASHPIASEKFPSFCFTPDAQAAHSKWSRNLHEIRIPGSEDVLIQQHLLKYEKLVPALALIFHLIGTVQSGPSGEISVDSLDRAIAWADYLEPHARRCYGLGHEDGLSASQALLCKIRQGRLPEGFTFRDIKRANWREFPTDGAIYRALQRLESDRCIRSEAYGGTGPGGGRPTVRYYVRSEPGTI